MARILAVDDSAAMRQMVGITLAGAGHQVEQAIDGCHALEIAEKQLSAADKLYTAAGATGWLVKPFNPERLLATVAKVLG